MSIQQPPLSTQIHALLKRFSANDWVERWYRIKPSPPSTGPCKGPSCSEALPGAGRGSVHRAPWSDSSHCAVLLHTLLLPRVWLPSKCFTLLNSSQQPGISRILRGSLRKGQYHRTQEAAHSRAHLKGDGSGTLRGHTLTEEGDGWDKPGMFSWCYGALVAKKG